VNILNKQLQTASKGWFSSLGVERRVTTPQRERKTACYEMLHKISEMDEFFVQQKMIM
jgi:hypothetical protein